MVVWLLEGVAVQTVRPDASRNTLRLPSVTAFPVVRPLLSRRVVFVPVVVAVPKLRPDESRKVVSPLDVVFVATQRLKLSVPGVAILLVFPATRQPALTVTNSRAMAKDFMTAQAVLQERRRHREADSQSLCTDYLVEEVVQPIGREKAVKAIFQFCQIVPTALFHAILG